MGREKPIRFCRYKFTYSAFFRSLLTVNEEKGKGQRRNKEMTAYLDAERDKINKRGKKTV